MVRDPGAVRRNPARASASEADENAPADGSDPAAAPLNATAAEPDAAAASRPPLLAIQPPASASGLKRKPESPAPTPSKLPFRTPEKAAARTRFGWAPPRAEDLPPRAGTTPYSATNTPRAHRSKAAVPAPAGSEGGSTGSTPTKSVTKPVYSAGMSGSRPVTSGGGARGAGLGLGFPMAARGTPVSFAPATVVSSVEVPQFELREDPSFWMENNVQVVIRVRPLNNTEKNLHGYNRCLKQDSSQTITWIGQPETRFTFDHVACEGVNQEVLFRVAGLPMVENCMAGYNSCIFAYGQTGSGKTYTMLGEISDLEVRPSPERGMTPRIFEFLFARIRAEEESRRDEKLKYNCKCSFLEIYNEQITDLLDPSATNLPLREDINGVYVENLTELEVGCVSDIIKLLMQGSMNRKVAATNMNSESSRSHSVFTCIIESRWEKDSMTNLRFARLNLVDLAGSERQRTSGAEGERLKEAANINKSLSTLGLVIMNLVDLTNGKQKHVPYRDSRLTFLLQDSLGGNSKTMIIANVSPSLCSGNETLSTLKFAQRARLIQNNAVVNEDASGDVLALQHQIRLLKEELAALKRQRVTRMLPFTTDIRGRSGGDVDNGADHMSVDEEVDSDTQNIKSLQDLRVSNKQMRSLEETLAGSLRRESMAEAAVKQLEVEIEQLNRLVCQREEDTRCAKMTLKFREDKIHRMEALVHNKLPAESYLLEEIKTLSQEIELLRAKVDKNPEVTRFALENIRLKNQLKRYQQFCDEGEREVLLDEVSSLRNQVLQILDGRILTEQQNYISAKFEDTEQFHSSLAGDPETLPKELTRTCQELEICRNELQGCLESNEKLTREIADLQKEYSAIKSTKREECCTVFENDSHALAKMEDCSYDALMGNTEIILSLQLELDILKSILAEERTAHVEVEERTTILGDELKAANLHVLQACKQRDAIESKLNDARSVIEALESQQILLINELDELKENNRQNIEILKRRDREISRLNTEFDNNRRQVLLATAEPKMQLLKCFENEDSPLRRKLKRMQASLEKAQDLNARYQSDQVSDSSAEQEMDEVRRQVEVETTEVIMCLQEELISLQQQLGASNRNESLAKQSLVDLQLEREELNDRLFGMMKEKESLSKLTEEKEKKIQLLTNDWESLQEELLSLQQQFDASKKNELLAKQRLDELQLEREQLNDRLLEAMKENESFCELAEEKEKKIQLLTNDRERSQEELLSLQQQLDASNKNELLAKQSLDELQLEREGLNERLLEAMKENESFCELADEKEKKIQLLANDRRRSQEELLSLQQQLDASNKNELLAKQSLDKLQLEREGLNERLLEAMKENESFCELADEKEKKIQLLTNDWERSQEEILSLQQQLDASNKNELLAKQSLDELQLEREGLSERLLEAMKENESFCELAEEKEKKIQLLTNDRERLQEELLSLQQQLDASNKNELLAKQSLDELQLERKQLNDRLFEVMKENKNFSALIEEKEKEIQLLTHDWDRLAAEIESFLVDGNASLHEASDQAAFISESFSQRRWVEDQVQKMCQGISDREKLLEELQSRLKEADDIKCDLDLKLRSLRGAMEAVNEMHQQERNDQEKTIALLRSQASEQEQVNQQQLEELQRAEFLLDESIGTFLQKEVLEQNYVSSLGGMEEEIHQLKTQLDESKKLIAHSLSQTKDKEQTFEKLKNEENTVLLGMLSDVLKAKGIIHEFGVGFNTLESSLSVDPEEVVCQNSHLNLEDRAELKTFGALEAGEQCNAVPLCHLSKEMQSAVYKLQTLQSQMAKLLQEKKNVKECLFQSQKTVKDLSSDVLRLKSQITDQQKCHEARLEELEIKMQEKDNDATTSLVTWHKEKEALEFEISEAKGLAQQKSFEAFTLISQFQEAQATIADAESTVKALVEANEKAKLQAEKYKQKESSFVIEKDDLLSEISSLKMLLDVKEQTYMDMEKKFESSLLEANEVALELEDGVRHLKNLLSENLEFVSSDIEWMRSELCQFAELARTWLEENWLEIIGKDCAVSVLHLCHMGILLERVTGLHAENGFLQRGISESNSLISILREHNDKAKNELEMCSVLKGKLLLDINHSFGRIAKKEREATELSSRLGSFGKKILHLQAQEEAMLARSDSMYNEISILTEEIDATNRSSLAAQSKEKEELHHQLDEALLLNAMLKDTMLEVLSLPEVNSTIPANDMTECNEFELCSWLVNYHHESFMINTIANDIESVVLASEWEQHKVQLQKQRLMFTDLLQRLKAEALLWKIDQDLGSVAIHALHEENSNIRIDLRNLKQGKDEVMESLHITSEENAKLRYIVDSLESNISSLQTDLDGKVKTLMELQCSHGALCKELELKAEIIELGISRENDLRSDNDSLKHEMLDILRKDQSMVHLVSIIDTEKLSASIQAYLEQITAQVQTYIDEQLNMVMKFSDNLDLVQLSVEELSTHNSVLQSELARKDELAKGLSFDLSLLQESASVAKDQADQLIELTETIKSLEHEVASKSHDLDNLVLGRQLLEAQIMEDNEKISVLEEQLANTVGEINAVSMENSELRSQLNHIEQISYSMKEELAHKSNATETMEERSIELRNLLDERSSLLQNLQNDFSKLSNEKKCCDSQVLILREKLEMAQAVAEESEAIAMEARQIADERKTHAEEKDEEVKVLESSIGVLESTISALENQVGNIKEEAERQRIQREDLEVELQKVRHQMPSVSSSGKIRSSVEDGMADSTDSFRHSSEIRTELLGAQESIRILQKEVAEKESEIAQCKSHISELNLHAEAAAREYKQKFMELEAMAQQVNTDHTSANACSTRPEKISLKPRGSGSPFKCIGLGFVQQVNSEKDEELSAAKQRIMELEGIAASRQREIFMLNAKLAATDSMTHDVIRDMLGVKMNMTTWATLVDKQQKMSTKESAIHQTEESKDELMKLKQRLDEFIGERQSWIDEINQRQSELGAARITIEQLRQKEHFMVAEVDLLKAENANYKTIIYNLEDEVKKLNRQQNLQLRINHHVKTKEENILLKKKNEELSAKLQQLGVIVTRTKEKLARYKLSDGKDPYEQIEEEELLRKKLEESEQDRNKLAENLSSLCISVLKVAGVRNHESDASLLKAMEALNQLQCCISSLESEVEDLKIKGKLLREKARLSDLRSDSSSLSSGAREGSRSPSVCRSPSISSFR